MALLIGDNFSYNGKKPNFERDSFETLAALKAVAEANIDNGHIAYCVETKKHYIFNDTNTIDESIGKWRELESEFSNKVNVSDLDNYLTKEVAQSTYQPVGDYATKSEIPTKVSELENDSNFLTSIPDNYVTDTELQEAISGVQFELPVATNSVLGGIKVGAGLNITEDGILSATGGGTADSVNWENVIGRPTNLSQFTNDSGFITNDDLPDLSNYALKSEIPTVPTNVSSFTNDAGYITDSALTNYALKTEIPDTSNFVTSNTIETALTGHLKTINGQSLIGSGNIVVEGGGAGTGITDVPNDSKTYARSYGMWIDITGITDWITWGEYD